MGPCPWSSFSQTPSRFCEDAICGFVQEPANTWSNVGFVIAGVLMLRDRQVVPPLIRRFGLVCILVGIGSAAFHATRTYAGGVLDLLGMQGAAAFILAANARRLFPGDASAARDSRRFWSIAVVGVGLSVWFEEQARALFAFEMVAAGVMEIALLRRAFIERAHAWLALSWTTFVGAYALWWLDLNRALCDSAAHVVNGHAMWHLLLAASLFSVQRFHAALNRALSSPPAAPAHPCS